MTAANGRIVVTHDRATMPSFALERVADGFMTIDEESGAHWRPALGGAHLM